MAMPGMALTPVIMNTVENRTNIFKGARAKFMAPAQVLIIGAILTFATPLACAIFEQKSSISVGSLEPEIVERMREGGSTANVLYFNKGL